MRIRMQNLIVTPTPECTNVRHMRTQPRVKHCKYIPFSLLEHLERQNVKMLKKECVIINNGIIGEMHENERTEEQFHTS